MRTTKQQLEVYRQAALKEAFEGLENLKPIKDISTVVTSGSRGWAKYYSDDGAKFIRIGNLTRSTIAIDLEDLQHVKLPENAEGNL